MTTRELYLLLSLTLKFRRHFCMWFGGRDRDTYGRHSDALLADIRLVLKHGCSYRAKGFEVAS